MLQPALRRRLPTTAAATGALSRSAHRQAFSSTSLVLAGPRASGGIRARPWEALQLQRGGARRGLAVETSEPTPVPPPPPAPRNYVYPAVLALTAAAVVFVMMTCVLVSVVHLYRRVS